MESSDRRFEEHERCKVTWPYGCHARLFPIVSGGEEFFTFLLLLFFFYFLFFGFFTTLQVFLCTELNINAWSFCNTFLSQPLYWTGVTRNYKEYSLSVLSLWIVPRNIIRATFISESRDCSNKTPVPSSQRKTSGTQGSSLAFSSLRQSCFCRAELFKIQELS